MRGRGCTAANCAPLTSPHSVESPALSITVAALYGFAPLPDCADRVAPLSALCRALTYDFLFGFVVLITLSLAHVLLEFPLNAQSLVQLGSLLRRGRQAA